MPPTPEPARPPRRAATVARRALLLGAALALAGCERSTPEATSTEAVLQVRVAPHLLGQPYAGRVYVQIMPVGDDSPPEPRLADRWFAPPAIYARDVDDWDGGALDLTDTPLHFPHPLSELPSGDYLAQAFIRLDRFSADPGRGKDDLISAALPFTLAPGQPPRVLLTIDRHVPETPTPQLARTQWIEHPSELLSDFHGFDYPLQAGVRLPEAWDPLRASEYPVLIYIGGFSDDHVAAMQTIFRIEEILGESLDPAVIITPNARNYRGHSAFVDSESIGPWGTALGTELLPEIERRFGLGGAARRHLAGISSGGWSCLWLQVRWPEEFQHAWCFVPDPVDFSDFQRIDLYQPGANFYTTPDGRRRAVARMQDRRLWFDDFIRHERVLGPGNQIHSFEATFSPRGADGEPRPLFDRDSGEVDPEVAAAFRNHDISAYLREHWGELAPRLAGKLTVIAGAEDNFFLEGAVRRLAATLAELDADADVRVIDQLGHSPHPPTLQQMATHLRAQAPE